MKFRAPRTLAQRAAVLAGAVLLVCSLAVVASGAGRGSLRSPRAVKAAAKKPNFMIIMYENRERFKVTGNPSMPFFTKLTKKFGDATEWAGVTHPSLPNYIALISGATQGIIGDESNEDHQLTGDNIGTQLSKAGVPWKAYMEDMPAPCSGVEKSGHNKVTGLAEYVVKHNPFLYFTQVSKAADCASHVVPASQLDTDLSSSSPPNYIFYTPNMCNDGHDCPEDVVDKSIKGIVTRVMKSDWYRQNGTIIVTWDEGTAATHHEAGGRIGMVIVTGSGKKPAKLETPGDHYSTLRTWQEAYGLRPILGEAVNEKNILQPFIDKLQRENPFPQGKGPKPKKKKKQKQK